MYRGLKQLDKEVPHLEGEFRKINEQVHKLRDSENKLREKVTKARDKYTEAQSSFAQNRNQNKVLSFLSRLKQEGKLPGLFGRLVSIQKHNLRIL